MKNITSTSSQSTQIADKTPSETNTCYLCQSPHPETIRAQLRHDIRRNVLHCPSCSLVWLEPQTADLHEYYKGEYRKQYSPSVVKEMAPTEIFEMYLPLMADRVERVRPHVDKSMKVLEIGCATGYFLAGLEPYVGERVGLELNESHAAFVRERLGIEVYSDPIERIDCPKNSFDVIFMFHVLEHIEDPIEFIRTASQYLTPNGKFYIEVPNVDDALLASYKVEAYADFYYKEPHIFYYSPSTLRMVTERAGFKGNIEMIQRYGLSNHLHWVGTQTPQSNAEVAMGHPVLLPERNGGQPGSFEVELRAWLEDIDREYRRLLEKHQQAEAMAFVGTLTDSS